MQTACTGKPFKEDNKKVTIVLKTDFNIHLQFLFIVFFSLLSHAVLSNEPTQLQGLIQRQSSPFQWKIQLGNEMFANEIEESNLFVGRGVLAGNVNLSSSVDLIFNASLQAKMGRSQSRYHTVQGNAFSLSKAYLQWQRSGFNVQAGAINQQHLNMPLLISSRPFPALKGEYQHSFGNLSLKVNLQQAIPVSESLESDRIEKEKNPSLRTFNLGSEYRWSPALKVMGSIGSFEYRNLPSKVAYESSLLGNTVPFPQQNNSQFAFPFRGYQLHLGLTGKIRRHLDGSIGFKQLENSEAPTGFNRGQLLYTQLSYSTSHGLLGLGGEIFYNESDSAPAYYNHKGYGNNNREGYKLFVQYDAYSSGIRMKLDFYNSNVIEANLYQNNQQILILSMETFYESL